MRSLSEVVRWLTLSRYTSHPEPVPARLLKISYASALFVGVALAACGDSSGADITCGDPPIAVTVANPTTTPRISWTSACPVQELDVSYLAAGNTRTQVWRIAPQATARPIGGPVTYGQVPSGATEVQSPEPLVAGVLYQVHMTGNNPSDQRVFIAIGGFTH